MYGERNGGNGGVPWDKFSELGGGRLKLDSHAFSLG